MLFTVLVYDALWWFCVFSWRVLDFDFGYTVYVFIFLCGNESMYQESFGTSLLTNCDVELEST